MRPYARDYVFYLRRRVEDYPVEDMPTPKWTDLDHEAVAIILDELERLHRFYGAARPELDRRGSRLALTLDDTPASTYDAPAPRRRERVETLLIVFGSVAVGAFARLLYDVAARAWPSL